MRVDSSSSQSSQLSLATTQSSQSQQTFSGTYTAPSATDGNSSSGRNTVQISQAGQQAAAADGSNNSLSNTISPQMDIFKSMMEQVLGVSIQSMQFTGDLSTASQSGQAVQASKQGGTSQSTAATYSASAMQLNLQGTVTTSDGRTINFSAEMSMMQMQTSVAQVSHSQGQGGAAQLADGGGFTNPLVGLADPGGSLFSSLMPHNNTQPNTGNTLLDSLFKPGVTMPLNTSNWPSLITQQPQPSASTASPAKSTTTTAPAQPSPWAATGSIVSPASTLSNTVQLAFSINEALMKEMYAWLQSQGGAGPLSWSAPTTTSPDTKTSATAASATGAQASNAYSGVDADQARANALNVKI